MSTSVFRSDFLKQASPGLRRRRDYGKGPAARGTVAHKHDFQDFGWCQDCGTTQCKYVQTDEFASTGGRCPDAAKRYGYCGRHQDKATREERFPSYIKQAASGAAPKEYPVKRKRDGYWYVIGLPGEELSEGDTPEPTVATPDSWLNVHEKARNLELAEQMYRELYAEFQTNDNLREGDTFGTPVGKFICTGVDVLPHDELAKKAIAEVDESYKCGNCGCDQGNHKKAYDDSGYPYYAGCSDHPECREYVRKGE